MVSHRVLPALRAFLVAAPVTVQDPSIVVTPHIGVQLTPSTLWRVEGPFNHHGGRIPRAGRPY